MLSARSEGNKVHIDELRLLYLGVGPIVGAGLSSDHLDRYRCNLGIRFAEALCAVKSAPTATTRGPRTERVGSILTSLFRHLKVDLSGASYVDELSRLDMQHLIFSKIINKGGLYRFVSTTGEDSFIPLPHPFVQLSTMEDLAFQPPPEFLALHPSRPSTRSPGGPSQPSTCSPAIPRLTYHSDAGDSHGEFELPHIADDADDAEYRRWMVSSTRTNNSLMRRILETLSRGCCHSRAARDSEPAHSASTSSSGRSQHKKKRRTRGTGASSR